MPADQPSGKETIKGEVSVALWIISTFVPILSITIIAFNEDLSLDNFLYSVIVGIVGNLPILLIILMISRFKLIIASDEIIYRKFFKFRSISSSDVMGYGNDYPGGPLNRPREFLIFTKQRGPENPISLTKAILRGNEKLVVRWLDDAIAR